MSCHKQLYLYGERISEMAKDKKRKTKKNIVSAAWRLFYEQGYDNTTVDDIVDQTVSRTLRLLGLDGGERFRWNGNG